MERIQVLIEKLQQQYQQKEGASSMLVTLQLLQNELTALQKSNKVLGTSKVAVVMPYSNRAGSQLTENQTTPVTPPLEASIEIKPQPATDITTTEKKQYQVAKPVAEQAPQETVRTNAPFFNYEDAVLEAPTLLQQQIHKEVHELIANPKESLNDRLKQDKKELAHENRLLTS